MTSEKRCQLHYTILCRKTVPLRYGLQKPDPDLREARAGLFPNSKSFLLGGCCVGSSEFETEDWVCKDCRKAEAKWRRKANWREEPWQHWTEK